MPRKRSSPILQKVTNLLKISIFIPNMGKPIIPNLFSLKKTQKKLKKFKLLKHYNYGFVQQYEFSSSNDTPLIQYYHRKVQLKKRNINYRNLYSIFISCNCLMGSSCLRRSDGGDGDDCTLMEYDHAMPAAAAIDQFVESFDSGDQEEDDSVDERAERFIEKFYEQMRMQKIESHHECEVLELGCC